MTKNAKNSDERKGCDMPWCTDKINLLKDPHIKIFNGISTKIFCMPCNIMYALRCYKEICEKDAKVGASLRKFADTLEIIREEKPK